MWSWGGSPHRRNSSTRLVMNSCIPVRCSSNSARLSCGVDAGPVLAVLSISDFRRDGAIRPIGTHTGSLSHWCELRECPIVPSEQSCDAGYDFRPRRSPVKGRLHARFLVEILSSSRRPSEQIPVTVVIAIEYSGFLFAGNYLAFFCIGNLHVTTLHT